MKLLTLAAGLAAGYVLGTKAGRARYEQIAATARKVSGHPTVVQAQEKAKGYLQTGGEAVTTKLKTATADTAPATRAVSATPRPRDAGPAVMKSDAGGDPLL
jgi:hypothetical protein